MPQAEFISAEDVKSKEGTPACRQASWGRDLPWSMWAMMEKLRIWDWSNIQKTSLLPCPFVHVVDDLGGALPDAGQGGQRVGVQVGQLIRLR